MDARQRLLMECFSLVEHPFEPEADARRGLNFRALGVSLARPLDVFRVEALDSYFVRVGPFRDAVQQIDDYLVANGYPSGVSAPAFLIEGARGVGRTTLASFLGYRIKTRSAGIASLNNVPVTTEHFGRLLFTIKNLVNLHVTRHQIPNCETAFALFLNADINPQDPSINYLGQIFAELAQCMAAAPPLILVIESLTWERRTWIERLYALLSPLNIVLVFLTDDRRVHNFFRELRTGSTLNGREVSLDKLDRQMAEEFLKHRLDIFRSHPSPIEKTGLFPFVAQTLNQTIRPGEKIGIKLLEQILRGAFNVKMEELYPQFLNTQPPDPQFQPEQLLIPFDYLSRYYSSAFASSPTSV
jgi:hypothetical protein